MERNVVLRVLRLYLHVIEDTHYPGSARFRPHSQRSFACWVLLAASSAEIRNICEKGNDFCQVLGNQYQTMSYTYLCPTHAQKKILEEKISLLAGRLLHTINFAKKIKHCWCRWHNQQYSNRLISHSVQLSHWRLITKLTLSTCHCDKYLLDRSHNCSHWEGSRNERNRVRSGWLNASNKMQSQTLHAHRKRKVNQLFG